MAFQRLANLLVWSCILLHASAGLDLCPWIRSPPLLFSKAPSCQKNHSIDFAYAAQFVNRDQQAIDALWDGPFACAGDLCVYSSPGFLDGRGIVVVGTARNTEAIALGFLTENSKPAVRSDADRLFGFRDIPGKGQGVVALRPIRRGEAFLTQYPILVVDRRVIDLSEDEQLRLYEVAMGNLPKMTVMRFLLQATQSSSKTPAEQIRDIVHTNSFNMVVAGVPHVANFLSISRLNHDCRPNLAFHISPNLRHVTHAVRDIPAGEELTISYLDSFRARGVRRARAKANWGFECTCSHCGLPDPLADASDQRLLRLYHVHNRLRDWRQYDDNPVVPDSLQLLLSLYRQERLDHSMADAYTIVALNYNGFEMAEMAIKYAHLALEAGLIEYGPKGADVIAIQEFLKDPKEHWSWGRRLEHDI